MFFFIYAKLSAKYTLHFIEIHKFSFKVAYKEFTKEETRFAFLDWVDSTGFIDFAMFDEPEASEKFTAIAKAVINIYISKQYGL